MNDFLKSVQTAAGSAYTENGAKSYASTGSELTDQFGKAASYRGRDISVVFDEQQRLWDENPEAAVKFPFYLRLITRQVKFDEGKVTDKVQKGSGNRDEAFKRLLWLAEFQPAAFYRNIWVLPAIGSWKDLWQLLFLDSENHKVINKNEVFALIADGIVNENTTDLVRKYLPRIRSTKKCTTPWAAATNALAKEFVTFLNKNLPDGFDVRDYRELKTEGKAHKFQQYITKGLYNSIDFKSIPGKALLNLVSGKFLDNHNLTEKYVEWLKSQPVVKFNGYPYELGMKLDDYRGRRNTGKDGASLATKITVDKQFENLIKTGKKDGAGITGNVWCALDTSGSMTSPIGNDTNLSAYTVCKSLGIYFATLNEGAFHKNVIMFDSYSRVKQLSGSFSEMWKQIPDDAMGSTNFQSVVDEIVRTRRSHPEIPLEDYPTTLLVVSDMQFNPTGSYWWSGNDEAYAAETETNINLAKHKLRSEFPDDWVDNFKFVWWNVRGHNTNDFPDTLDGGGSYFFSGFDGAVISLLLGGQPEVVDTTTGEKRQPTMQEIIDAAFNQEILALVK